MHYNECRSDPDHNIATETHKYSAGALRRWLASQKFEDFLEGFFAVLAIVYFVAAATFAGVLVGNAFGS